MTEEFEQLIERAGRVGPEYQELVRTIAVLGEEGGKRLRPHISMLLYEAYSKKSGEDILTAAVAQEFLHLAMLIHDDLMDRDLVRYGVKNVAGQYRDIYEPLIEGTARRSHEADSMAILAGDLLQSRTYRLANQIETTPERKERIEALMSDTVERVIGGQVLDTQAILRSSGTIDPLVVAENKTASYTFEMPLLIGAILGGADEHELTQLEVLGKIVGIGYQVMDDLLGIFGEEASTGKSIVGDIREGKQTILVQRFRELAKKAQQEEFDTIYGNHHATVEQIARVRALLIESGARKALEKELSKIANKASRIVEGLAIDSKYKAAFIQLVSRGLDRKK
jgi:geranylgeranyl diphosphate synthase, type II